MTYAVALFVKTPSISPIKTRLAKSIGENAALNFYNLSVAAITHTLKQLQNHSSDWQPYFAIAEESGLKKWPGFPTIFQGDGDLGLRLHRVYDYLITRHRHVFLIGADCPQLSEKDFYESQELLRQNETVMIPARDGGFVLFGGKDPIAQTIWTNITYSTAQTSQELIKALPKTLSLGPPRSDADLADDLPEVLNELENLESRHTQHNALIEWIRIHLN